MTVIRFTSCSKQFKHKENYLEDLKKARWYLDYWIKVVEENKETA